MHLLVEAAGGVAVEDRPAEGDVRLGVAVGPQGLVPAGDDDTDFSFVPLDGVAAVGSTFLEHEPDPAAWVEPILAHAARFVPAVTDAPIRGTRSCPRPHR